MARWLGIETRPYNGPWRPFDFAAYSALEVTPGGAQPVTTFQQPFDELCATVIEIDGQRYVSHRLVPSDGRTMYLA